MDVHGNMPLHVWWEQIAHLAQGQLQALSTLWNFSFDKRPCLHCCISHQHNFLLYDGVLFVFSHLILLLQKFCLALCIAFIFLHIMSLKVVDSWAGNLSVKIQGVLILWPNISWFGLNPLWFWRAFLALTAHAKVICGSHLTSSKVFCIASASIRSCLSTIPLLNGDSAAVVAVSIFNVSFISR